MEQQAKELLVDAIWAELPDFRESYEISEGLFRRQVPDWTSTPR
jgi:hypothetical protein